MSIAVWFGLKALEERHTSPILGCGSVANALVLDVEVLSLEEALAVAHRRAQSRSYFLLVL